MSLVDFIITCASKLYWRQQTGSGSLIWSSIASSSDGAKLAACGYDNSTSTGYIYTSTDTGDTWTPRGSSKAWYAVASSSDGVRLVAIANSTDYIYTSSDSGVTWVAQTGSANTTWGAIASSSNGSKLVAARTAGRIYTSTDYGVSWTSRTGAPSTYWNSVASSSDGTKLAACGYDSSNMYASSDSGATWATHNAPATCAFFLLTSSSDGTKLAAVAYNFNTSRHDRVITSTDSGVSWAITATFTEALYSITCSADGATVVLGGTDYVYVSQDSGSTFVQTSLPGTKWYVACSSDGIKKAAAPLDPNYICIYK